VAVIGLPDPEYGEEVAAVIQVGADADREATAAAVREALAARLARFKIPTSIQFTVEELPRTATGKLLKRELKAAFARSAQSEPAE
jgi:long-chain acyl-CoA synthetase